MFIEQNGKCAICQGIGSRGLGVDHNHKTGHVRGLLCRHCNLFLGIVEKKWSGMFNYLRKYDPDLLREILGWKDEGVGHDTLS